MTAGKKTVYSIWSTAGVQMNIQINRVLFQLISESLHLIVARFNGFVLLSTAFLWLLELSPSVSVINLFLKVFPRGCCYSCQITWFEHVQKHWYVWHVTNFYYAQLDDNSPGEDGAGDFHPTSPEPYKSQAVILHL